MITIHFIHSSLPIGGLRVELPVVPSSGEAVYLDETIFVVNDVGHIVYSRPNKDMSTYVAFVYLLDQTELDSAKKNDENKSCK